MDKICKTCSVWMPKQRQLNYSSEWGICEKDLQHDWDVEKSIKIICTGDPFSNVTESHLDSDGSFKSHKILVCTRESFGCNKWTNEKEEQDED